MKNKPNAPLTEREWHQLECWVEDNSSFSADRMHGTLNAAAMHPSLEMRPSDWLPLLLGSYEHETLAGAQQTIGLIMRAYNEIIRRLNERRAIIPPLDLPEPLQEWCNGFWECMNLDPEWRDDELACAILDPVILVALRPEMEPELLEDLEATIAEIEKGEIEEAVYGAHEYFKELRAEEICASRATNPRRATSPRVGRNDPCPCGSGKKYKRCCLDADRTS